MEIIDGQTISEGILNEVKKQISQLAFKPRLDIVFVGKNPSSQVYVKKKQQAGGKVGIEVVVHKSDTITAPKLEELITELADNREVNGIIIQMPVPDINPATALKLIPVIKDVDALNPLTLGLIWQNDKKVILPATPAAILEVLRFVASKKHESVEVFLRGKNVLLINRSLIIGKPLAGILTGYDATVTIAHSKTTNLNELTSYADIIVSGTGHQGLIDFTKLKSEAIVIDAGYNKSGSQAKGDINPGNVTDKVAWLSPVPGGIGPIGVAMLIRNTLEAAKLQSVE